MIYLKIPLLSKCLTKINRRSKIYYSNRSFQFARNAAKAYQNPQCSFLSEVVPTGEMISKHPNCSFVFLLHSVELFVQFTGRCRSKLLKGLDEKLGKTSFRIYFPFPAFWHKNFFIYFCKHGIELTLFCSYVCGVDFILLCWLLSTCWIFAEVKLWD